MDVLARISLGSSEAATKARFQDWHPVPQDPTRRLIAFLGEERGLPVAVICYFAKTLFSTKLARVVVNLFPERQSDSQAEAVHEVAKQDLLNVYGQPRSEETGVLGGGLSSLLTWVSGSTVVTLGLALTRDGATTMPPVAVGIADGRWDPGAKLALENFRLLE